MLNKVILMGRLTADPELKRTPNGVSVATFSLAVSRNYNKDITDFINIVAWRQTADFISKYFSKGQLIALEGELQTRNYEDKQGNKRTAVEVIAEQVYFAEPKNSSNRTTNDMHIPTPTEINECAKDTSFSVGTIDEYEEIGTDEEDLPF